MQESLSHKQKAVKDWLATGSINLLGLPLAGKDTQAELLSRWLEAPIISGGSILREHQIPNHLRQTMDIGRLIDTPEYLEMIVPYLSRDEFQGKPLILNSLGRTHGEEQAILSACQDSNHPVKAVILLKVEDAVSKQRWGKTLRKDGGRQRRDDDPEAFQLRLRVFHQETVPVIDFYRNEGLLLVVDGAGNIQEVQRQIIDKLHAVTEAG